MYQDLTILTDAQLIASLKTLVLDERKCLVAVLRHLREMDRRRLADESGFPSLFEYCVRELRYAHGATARLIHASRAAAKYPVLYRALERGLLSLTTVSMLAPYLTRQNYRELIRSAMGRSTREVEALVASMSPVPAAPVERVRFIAVAATEPLPVVDDLFTVPIESATVQAKSAPSAAPAAPVVPTVPVVHTVQRVHFSFTGDEAFLRDFERAKELSRHRWPAGRLEDVLAGAIKALLAKIDPDRRIRRKERVRRLRAGALSRNISQSVKDEVWRRDGGRCAFEAPGGRACGARANLEFDHVRPWALGGSAVTGNIRLLCRAHNDLEARRVFGGAVIDAAAARRRGALRRGGEI